MSKQLAHKPNWVRIHQPCPSCTSSDAYAEDDQGGGYCFSCGYTVKSDGYRHKKEGEYIVLPAPKPYLLPPDMKVSALPRRGISESTCARYGVGVTIDGDVGTIWFPIYENGIVLGAKQRYVGNRVPKEHSFGWAADSDQAKEHVTLFGKQAVSSKFNLIITEGYEDALAAYEMLNSLGKGSSFSIVSIPFGSQSALKYIKRDLSWVEKFETVYVNFDMDEPGRLASTQVMELLKPGKAKEVTLPLGHKDANDMLLAGKAAEYLQCIYGAQARTPKGFIPKAEMIARSMDWLKTPTKRRGISTGYKGLDEMIGGFRPGEVYTLVAGTGVGKSVASRNLLFNLMLQDVPSLYIPLEDMAEQSSLHFASMFVGEHLTRTETPPDDDVVIAALERALSCVSIYDQTGAMTIEALEEAIEYGVRGQEAKVVILDNLSVMAEGLPGSALEVTNKIMAKARQLSRSLGITFIVVSHIARDKNDKDDINPSLARLKNSSAIGQVSDCVLALSRERNSDSTKLFLLKHNRTWGRTTGAVTLDFDVNSGRLNERLQAFEEDYEYEEETAETETKEVQVRVREGSDVSSTTGSSSDVRAREVPDVHTDELHPGLDGVPARRDAPSDRVEGTPYSREQVQVSSLPEAVSRNGIHPYFLDGQAEEAFAKVVSTLRSTFPGVALPTRVTIAPWVRWRAQDAGVNLDGT